jgi:spore maturation protein CgeB
VETIAALPLYDLVACYGREAVAPFQLLGARRTEWVPLAGDPHMHLVHSLSEADKQEYGADISFIGGWCPEREEALGIILAENQYKNVKIWGPDWKRRCSGNQKIVKAWQGRPLYGEKFAKVHAASRICLNIIDDTNYPAANMRFFEIPMAGGLQVCSLCPEMENEFRHGETIFYFKSTQELPVLIRNVLADDSLCLRVARTSHELVMYKHTYRHRVQKIMEIINVSTS